MAQPDSENNNTTLSEAVKIIVDKVISLENSHLHQERPQIVNDVLSIVKGAIIVENT